MRQIQEIPINRIQIINPRERDPAQFSENVASIKRLGLKRPVVVNNRYLSETGKYELVCGQGRLEAVTQLGWESIPSLMVNVDRPTALLMSIAENAARQTPSPIWFAKMVKTMHDSCMTVAEIGEVLGKSEDAIYGYLKLINEGEDILLSAVEQGRVSVSVAIEISRVQDQEQQRLLLEGYEKGEFNIREMNAVRKLLDMRNRFGKTVSTTRNNSKPTKPIRTLEELREEIKRTLAKQEEFVQKSQRAENRLVILSDGFRRLRDDPDWTALIEGAGLTDFPRLRGESFAGLFEDSSNNREYK